MRTLTTVVVSLLSLTGCAIQHRALQQSGGFVTPAPQPAATPSALQPDNSSPRLMLPLTGGPPVMAIPVGGNLYLPLTGGPAVPGMPITP